MNLNQLAAKVTELEGGHNNLNIVDVKQVIRALRDVFKTLSISEKAAMIAVFFKKDDA